MSYCFIRAFTPEKVAEIRTLRAEGLLIRDIMERTGLSKASVYRALGDT